MVRKTAFVIALGTAGILAAPAADACVWALGSTAAGNTMLGTSFTQAGAATPGTTCGSSLTLTSPASNPLNGTTTNPVQLFNKQAGVGETGIGLTNDPSGDFEVTVGSSILIDVSGVLNSTGTMALSVDANSVQSGEGWSLSGGGSVLASGTGPGYVNGTEVPFTLPTGVTTLTFTATTGNVLLASFDSPEQGVPGTPEPASLAILGASLVGFGLMRRRWKS